MEHVILRMAQDLLITKMGQLLDLYIVVYRIPHVHRISIVPLRGLVVISPHQQLIQQLVQQLIHLARIIAQGK
jgi:hypothetical protein